MKTGIDFVGMGPTRRIALLSNIQDGEAHGNVIIVPPFGKTAKDLFVFAYYLWNAGWNVFRFDARNHVGFSDGEIADFTLSSLLLDLKEVSTVLAGRGFDRPVLLGISLSVPVLLKFAASDPAVSGLISVVGAVDVAFAIEQASGDVVAQYREAWPHRKPYQAMLGYNVRAEEFVLDMDRAGFAPLNALVRDAGAAPCPVHMIMADEDAWVEPDSMIRVHMAAPRGSVLTRFDGLTHEFGRSIRMVKLICLEVCRLCNLQAGAPDGAAGVPDFATILRASSAEAAELDAFSRDERAVGDAPVSAE